jgi:hypothetical protein
VRGTRQKEGEEKTRRRKKKGEGGHTMWGKNELSYITTCSMIDMSGDGVVGGGGRQIGLLFSK